MELNNDKTSIQYFNDYLRSFVQDIQASFPEYTDLLGDYYEDILSEESHNTDKHVKRFMRKMADFKEQISNKSADLYKEPVFILKNLDFKIVFESEDLSDESREKIWEYIQTLFVLGESIISDSERIKKLVKNFKRLREPVSEENNSESGVPEGTPEGAPEGAPEGTPEGEPEPDHEDEQILNMLKNLSERNQNTPLDENMFKDGMIGKLAQELSEELDIEKMGLNINEDSNVDSIFSNLLSGENPMKFMNLIQTVGQKIQTKMDENGLDQEQLVNEATSMMSNLQGGNSMFDNILKQASAMAGQGTPAPPQSSGNQGSSGNSTRDRLRRKLEQRKNNSSN
jgi:hypothetical protein